MPEAADPLDRLIDAALPHVAFDGWSPVTWRAAVADSGVDPALAATLCPRGAVDLAVAAHRRGDRQMASELRSRNLSGLRFRDKVAEAVKIRLDVAGDREIVRRGTTLFSLPQNAALGAKMIWETADAIWTALGDTSDDVNWYTKRATLAGVYSSTVLYWLGDESEGRAATWAFLDRRIEDVMRIEKAKATVQKNPVLKTLFAGPIWAASRIRPPIRTPRTDVPGAWPYDATDT
jgi:ubiquinone biosynthesis protein COQ9